MKFTSTRNKSLRVGFTQAVMNCLPKDGGMYVPCEMEDLRKWILYTDEDSTFSSIAGSLTSAFMHDIGKTQELSAFPMNDYTDDGQLLGHIMIGAEMVHDAARQIP